MASVSVAVLLAGGAALAVTPLVGADENAEAEAAAAAKGPDAALDRALKDLVAMEGGPPGVIAVVQRGERREVHTFGVANLKSERPMRADDRMRIASTAKAFSGAVTTNLDSDSGPVPEVTNSQNASTVNWSGDVISVVIGSTGNDTTTGNDEANDIFDGEGRETDTDTITAAGGNDLVDVQDGAGDDTVDCGEDVGETDNDTVYSDESDVITNCEEQNLI